MRTELLCLSVKQYSKSIVLRFEFPYMYKYIYYMKNDIDMYYQPENNNSVMHE